MSKHFICRDHASIRVRWAHAWMIVLCVLVALAWAPQARAHASLIDSMPKTGSVLSVPPVEARLTFNEPVSPLVLNLVQPDGSTIALERAHTEENGLHITLPALMQHGAYALSWRVVSADGHPVGAAVTFAVGTAGQGASVPSQAAATHPFRTLLIWLGRFAWYVGLFLGVGMAGFHALGRVVGSARRLCQGLLTLAAAATVLNIGLLGVDALDSPLSRLVDLGTWRVAVETSYGVAAALALMASGCAASVWRVGALGAKRWLAGLSVVLLGATMAASGHASAAAPAWLARPAVWLHVVAVTLWVGALLPLSQALGGGGDLAVLRRFSRWIPGALAALALSGGVLIYLQLVAVSSLWRTDYGQVLMMKLGLLAIFLALGAYNRYGLTKAVLRSEATPRRQMRRIIQIEFILALAILAVVALWRFTPPPRALSVEPLAAEAVAAHIHGEQAMVDLILTPDTHGPAEQLTLYLSKPDLTPIKAQEVKVAFSNTAADVEPITLSATLSGDGAWRVGQVRLPYQARWDVRIDILVSDFERISLSTTLTRPRQASP